MKSVSWDDLRSFLLVARHGSLSAAAERLGVSVATLGRRIDALESRLGVRLIRRSPQGAQVTLEGRRILDLVQPGAEHFEQIDRLARSLAADAERPPIRISSTEPMIAEVLVPHLPRLHAEHPEIRIELESSLELSNLNRGEADLAIRMVRPKGETLITRRLTPIRMGLYASPAYLAGRAAPLNLGAERLLWYDSAYGPIAENVWLKDHGLEGQVVLRSGSVRALTQAAAAGMGVAPLPAFLAEAQGLAPVGKAGLPDRTPWLVFHRDGRNSAPLKAVRAWIEEACRLALS